MQGRIPTRCARRLDRDRRCLRLVLRSEHGGMLVEIMMSALLVALAATAVFKGIDGATATSTQSKARAVATTLAHEDQERLRSMDPRKLVSYAPGPRKKLVNRVEYTISSTADWVSDRSDSESCTKGDGRITYVKISSKVEWPEMRGSKPVIASSIVAVNNAYSKGSLAVKIVDRTGATGVKDVPVSVDPPVSLTKSTNDAGCVVFDGLDSGAYAGQFSKTGYVDPNGSNVVRPPNGWNVTTGATAISTYQYDLGGTVNFAFDTTFGTNVWTIASPADNEVTMLHGNVPGPPLQGMRRLAVASGATSVAFNDLFPFTTPYAAYAGDCATGAPSQSVSVAPGQPGGAPVTLRMPTLTFKVTRTSGSGGGTTVNYQGARVKVTATNGACMNPRAYASLSPAKLTDSNGDLKPAGQTDAAVFAYPYGTFTVCADDGSRKNTATVVNDDPTGKATTINIDARGSTPTANGTTSGSC